MVAFPTSLPGAAAQRDASRTALGQICAALMVLAVVLVSAAVVANQPSGAEECVRDICPS